MISINILTMNRAVIDSFIHRLSSKRWPITIQAQRRATNRFILTMEAYSEVLSVVVFIFPTNDPKSAPIVANWSGPSIKLTTNIRSPSPVKTIRKLEIHNITSINKHMKTSMGVATSNYSYNPTSVLYKKRIHTDFSVKPKNEYILTQTHTQSHV